MALLAFDGQVARQRAAAAVFQHIAQFIHGSRFADDTVINQLSARFQHIDNFSRAVQRIALFVRSNQERNAALMIGIFGNETLAGGNKTGNAGFHIRRAATIQTAFTLGRFKRMRIPFFNRACRHDVGMSGKAEHRSLRTAAEPNIFGVTKMKLFYGKTDFLQAFGQQLLAVLVIRRNGWAGNQLFGKL